MTGANRSLLEPGLWQMTFLPTQEAGAEAAGSPIPAAASVFQSSPDAGSDSTQLTSSRQMLSSFFRQPAGKVRAEVFALRVGVDRQ